MAADSFMETARPPASSEGLVIFEPLESRPRLFCSIALDAARLLEATIAVEFVLITTAMVVSFLDECDVRRRHGSGWRAASDRPRL
jgi:hypothetical protein